jgi:cytochrome c oxidase subunit II
VANPKQPHGASRRRLIGATGATGALALFSLTALVAARPRERVIDVVAKKFKFVPEEIRVKKGETVVLRFTSPEVPMGANFADFKQRVDIVPGKPAELRLTPEQAGSFVFLCDVFCGTGHEEMSGTLIVT